MGVSEDFQGESWCPLNQPLTWMCPEGHVYKYRRRPLLSSCIFIFCFFIMERAAVYLLKTFLYVHVERSMSLDRYSPSFGYMLISIFYGVYDLSPIFIAFLSDTYLGGYKSISIFGFVFVFGLVLMALCSGTIFFSDPMGPRWCVIVSLLGLVAGSAGGLVPLLTAFGGAQFHPQTQTTSGSTFFSMIFASTNVGALIGIVIALVVYTTMEYSYVLLISAGTGMLGWLTFLVGSRLYVDRCVHTDKALRVLSLVWSCVRKRSFDQNRASQGGAYSESLVDDVVILARLVPIFSCLIPLYLGQLQVLTTVRTLGYKLARPKGFFGKHMPGEALLLIEPVTAVALTFVLGSLVYPALQRGRQMPTHLTRLTAGAVCICVGFISMFGIHSWLRDYGSEQEVFESISIFVLVGPLVLFAAGQVLVSNSGYELSYSHAPESLKSVSVSTFSLVYSLGSIVSLVLFTALQSSIDEPGRLVYGGRSYIHPIATRFDIYFAICGGLCMLSIVGLVLLRRFYEKTRFIKINRDVERRALEIALKRVRAMTEGSTVAPSTPPAKILC